MTLLVKMFCCRWGIRFYIFFSADWRGHERLGL